MAVWTVSRPAPKARPMTFRSNKVRHGRQVWPPARDPRIRDVRHPFRSFRFRLKLPVQQVFTNRQPVVRVDRGDKPPLPAGVRRSLSFFPICFSFLFVFYAYFLSARLCFLHLSIRGSGMRASSVRMSIIPLHPFPAGSLPFFLRGFIMRLPCP
jgi:hypothetical protein